MTDVVIEILQSPAGLWKAWIHERRKRKAIAAASMAMLQCFEETVGPHLGRIGDCESFEEGFQKVLDYYDRDENLDYEMYNWVWERRDMWQILEARLIKLTAMERDA